MFDIQMRPNRYYRALFRDIPRQQVLDMTEWCSNHVSAGGFNLNFYPHEAVPDTLVPDLRSGSFWFELREDFVLFELRWR
jgi:hypothetical protein